MRLVLEETIAAPKRTVFDVFTDLGKAPERIEGITKLEVLGGGPVGKGTRFRETRVMFGKEATEEMEITGFEAPDRYTVEGYSCGARFFTEYTFEGGQRETKVTMTMVTKNETLFAKVMGPIMGLMMSGAMKKAMAKDHAELRRACEELAASA
jgi:peptide subunit release factor 1 (eRF1)